MNIAFNFNSPSPRDPAIKQVSKLLGQSGSPVASATFDTKSSKRAGIDFKTVCLVMADGQRVELLVKATGDVFETRINGALIPVFRQADAAGAAKEIAAKLVAGRDKYQRKLAAQPIEPLPPAVRTARTTLLAKLAARRDGLLAEVEVVTAKLAEAETTPA
jgi:Defence against restriction A N-terminal